jgi:cytochrome P450
MPQKAAGGGTFELLTDYAQPYSVAVICSMLGVPRSDTQLLLDWSHAIVKMYELSTTDAVREAANTAAAEYIQYTQALIAEKRRNPDGLLVSELVRVEDEGDVLTEEEIVTTMVLLEAGHEATVNTLGNGMRAIMRHPGEWERVVSGEVPARVAVEEMLRWDPPLHLFERWVLDEGVEIAGVDAGGRRGRDVVCVANRDSRRFDDLGRFDVGRASAHVGRGEASASASAPSPGWSSRCRSTARPGSPTSSWLPIPTSSSRPHRTPPHDLTVVTSERGSVRSRCYRSSPCPS